MIGTSAHHLSSENKKTIKEVEMEQTFTTDIQPIGKPTRSLGQRLLRRVKHWFEVSRERHHLAQLDEHALKDLGISRLDARLEARRWFWDDPRY